MASGQGVQVPRAHAGARGRARGDAPLLVFSDMCVVDEGLHVVAPSFERFGCLHTDRTSFPQTLAQAIGAGCTFLMNAPLVRMAQRCADSDAVIMHDWWVTLGD